MGTAIVGGISALVLAVLSWLLTNGSRRSRLLARIERQSAALKNLPEGHAARRGIEASLLRDSEELGGIGAQSRRRASGSPYTQLEGSRWFRVLAGLGLMAALATSVLSLIDLLDSL